MHAQPTQHPDGERLTAFGLGRLTDEESAQVELHLAECDACRQHLEELPADSLVSLLQLAASETSSEATPESSTADDKHAEPVNEESLPPLYKKLASILTGKDEIVAGPPPVVEKAPPAVKRVAGFSFPRELEGHARYDVLAPLGAGGMGTVYKARHRLMGRDVALKIVNPLLVTKPGAVDRFEREVRAAAQLVHPNIVTAFDAEKVGDMHILVMEFVEGETLAQVQMSQRELPIAKACDYLRQTAIGLQHALERGMVHRDIKPQNLMLTPKGEIKILDFGLARFVSEQGASGGSTEHGALMGSPDYMAPEQAHDAHAADARADIYGMGCTLYHLLAGQVPFPGVSLMQKLEAHRDQPPIALNLLRGDVPAELANVVAKMMAKDPTQRYQTPDEVAEALAPFVKARGDTTPRAAVGRVGNPAYDKGRLVVLGAIAVALLLVGVGYWVAQIVFRVETPQGKLIVRSKDPDVKITILSGGKKIHVFSPREKTEIPLNVGPYGIEIEGGKKGLKLSASRIDIRNAKDERVVEIEFEPVVAEKKKDPDPRPRQPRKLSEIVDLNKSMLLVNEQFDDPKHSSFGWGEFWPNQFKDGRILLHGDAAYAWGGHQFTNDIDFVCEVSATNIVTPQKGWGLEIHDGTREKEGGLLGIEILLSGEGDLQIVPSRWMKDDKLKIRPIGPIRIANFKPGVESNAIAAIVRGGKSIEIFVNGVEACPPLTLEPQFSHRALQLASLGGDKASILGFDSFKVWHVEPPPAPIPSIDELLKTREKLTVAQDGSGGFKTIQAALDKVQAGQVILVKGKGPYRETLRKDGLPPNIALVSVDGARVEVDTFTQVDKSWYWAAWLRSRGGIRVNGFTWVGAPLPKESKDPGVILDVAGNTDIVIENCAFINPTADALYGLRCNCDGIPGRTVLQENYFDSNFMANQNHGDFKIQRNWFARPNTAQHINLGHAGRITVRENVFQNDWGFRFVTFNHKSRSIPGVDLRVHNNVFDVADSPGYVTSAPDGLHLIRSLEAANNIMRSRSGHGIQVPANVMEKLKEHARVGPNAYDVEPKGSPWGNDFLSWPRGAKDVLSQKHFLSVNPDDANYLRIAANDKLATDGAGGELPTHFGPFPPGPEPKDGDWFTRMRAKFVKPQSVDPVPVRPLPDFQPLAEYLKGREVLTVAQDGKAMFTTINAAIDKLKPNQVIKVLDKGPYREVINRDLPENVGFVSEVGTRIEIPDWQKGGQYQNKQFHYAGLTLRSPRNVRFSGFEIVAPLAKPVSGLSTPLSLTADGDITLELTRVLHTPRYGMTAPRSGDAAYMATRVDILSWTEDSGRVTVRDNYLECALFFNKRGAAITVQHNHLVGWRYHSIDVWAQAKPREVVIRHNFIQGHHGVHFSGHDTPSDHWAGVPVAITNNVFDTVAYPLSFFSNDESKKGWYPRNVRIQNNTLRSQEGRGVILSAKGFSEVRDVWKVDHNCYQHEPGGIGGLASFPKHGADQIEATPFLSFKSGAADFLRIAANSPLATKGAGGDLPKYIGALPPGPAPKGGDWFTRLPHAFLWPTDALAERRIIAPDFSRSQLLFHDDFEDPRGGWHRGESWKGSDSDYDRGCYFIRHQAGGHTIAHRWTSPGDYACEISGRATGKDPGNRWGLEMLQNWDQKAGIRVMLRRDGGLELAPARGDWPAMPCLPAETIYHPAIRKGDAFNTLLVVIRQRRLEVYVNGIAVCDPILLDRDVAPGAPNLSFISHDHSKAEFERMTVWSLDGVPTPEDRLARGEVPVKAPPLEAFAWPVDALREGRVTMPDLTKLKVRFKEDFDVPRDSVPQGVHKQDGIVCTRSYEKGRYVVQHDRGFWSAWQVIGETQTNFVCQVEARATGSPLNAWIFELGSSQQKRGLKFFTSGEGKLRVHWTDHGKGDRPLPLSMTAHPAIKMGEAFNTLTVVLRGRRCEIYMNGLAVCDPLLLDVDPGPVSFIVGMHSADKGGRAEFERIAIYAADGLPTSEERLAKGDVPVKTPAFPAVKELVENAKTASKERRFEEALSNCNLALRQDWTDLEAIYQRAWPQWNLGQTDQAIAAVTEVLRRSPDHHDALHNRTFYYLNTNRFDECIADANNFLARHKGSGSTAGALANRGAAWAQKGRFENGLADFEAAVKVDARYAMGHHWKGIVLARMGEQERAKTAFAEAVKLDKNFATYGTDRLDHVAPQPVPLAEWLQGRTIITVSQDGKGQYKRIQDALDAVKAGQCIRILDKGPYRERLDKHLPENVGIISDVGTRIELPEWKKRGIDETDKSKTWYTGWALVTTKGLRLSGLEFDVQPMPADGAGAVTLDLYATGEIVLENCRILHQPRFGAQPPGAADLPKLGFVALLMQGPAEANPRPRVFLSGNHIEGILEFHHFPAQIVVERNRLFNWTHTALIAHQRSGEVVVRENMMHGRNGMVFLYLKSGAEAPPSVAIRVTNNFIDVEGVPVAFRQDNDKLLLPSAVRVQNNIFRTQPNSGAVVVFPTKELENAAKNWQVGHNSHANAVPKFADQVPQHAKDVIAPNPFMATDAKDANYLRIAPDSPLASGGVGGAWPTYIGTLPPGPAPKEGDWFSRLLSK